MASTVICPSTAHSPSTSSAKNYHHSACILRRHVRTLSSFSSQFGPRLSTNTASTKAMPINKSYRSGFTKCFSAPSSPPSVSLPSALLFDCDGVLVDTEKDGHRISFNDTFAEVPQVKAKALTVCLVPADVRKPTVRLEKAAIVDGTCFWENPICPSVGLKNSSK